MSRKKADGAKGERTLLTAMLLSAPGPLVTGIAAVTSQSATQLADFIRRTAELVATCVSWWVFRRIQRTEQITQAQRERLQRGANLAVAIAMLLSGLTLFLVGISRLFVYKASGNVTLGLVIAFLGLVVNTVFWLRYRAMCRERFDAVIAGQQRLYRAKVMVDACVVIALAAVAIAPLHPATRYIDAVGTIVVAVYLLYNGLDMLRKARRTKGTA